VEDVATRVICANRAPDHTTIARFRQRHEDALAGLFGEVLWLCAGAGLVRVGVIAVDGTKVQANASHHATRDYAQIAKEILEHADAVDAEEDERFGDARGDELPEALSTPEGRQRWLRDARRRLDDKRAREARPIPGPRPKRLKEAKRRLEEDHQVQLDANAAYEDYRRHGRMKNGRRLGAHSPPKPWQPPAAPEGKINLSDLDSRNVKTPRGWVQGYNAQAVTTADQIVIAAEVAVASPDFGHLEPMVNAAQAELDYAGVADRLDVVLADAGYWHQVQMQRLMADGLQVLVPPDANKRKGERPGWQGGLYTFMRRVLSTEPGGELYARRQGMIEPVFGHTKFNPPLRPIPQKRQIGLQVGMATHQRHPQPAEALEAHRGAVARLKRDRAICRRHFPRSASRLTAARQASVEHSYATASMQSSRRAIRSLRCSSR
jgi:hypothetical protein